MKREISKCLVVTPYATAAFLQEFTPQNNIHTSDHVNYANVPDKLHFDYFDQTEFAIGCNSHITDFELFNYIKMTKGRIQNILYEGLKTYED